MIYDDQHGWVDRGTKGVRGGAVVRDVWAERFALDLMMRHAHSSALGGWRELDERLMRDHLAARQDGRRRPRVMRYEEWCEVQQAQHSDVGERINSLGLHFLRRGDIHRARREMARSCHARLASLAPCYAVVADGRRKRIERALGGER